MPKRTHERYGTDTASRTQTSFRHPQAGELGPGNGDAVLIHPSFAPVVASALPE
jgi:hypothetical protein